ncbi:hypothetical protein [Meiothermus sp. QL-1]|uniref:hypothetical protein n=1 Tax=Meiothermus sp. QL-1 TaxID=2058095 RepID=UPI001F23792A|nr:hypothetical protein [Meiothermus sp. QL-1]
MASRAHSGEVAGVPYLLQPSFPLLLANTAFGYDPEATSTIEARFRSIGAPPAFTLPEGADASGLLARGYRPVAVFELCAPKSASSQIQTEQVPWSEAWRLARLITEAYQAPQWRLAFAQAVGRLLQSPENTAFVAYLEHEALGAALVGRGVGLLLGVLPSSLGQGVGSALLGRLYPGPFIRPEGSAVEFPGQPLQRFVRYAL